MGSWFYVDSWDWVLEGDKYAWRKMYSSDIFKSADMNVVESNRRVGFQNLRTEQGFVRCFVWDPAKSSWVVCEEETQALPAPSSSQQAAF